MLLKLQSAFFNAKSFYDFFFQCLHPLLKRHMLACPSDLVFNTIIKPLSDSAMMRTSSSASRITSWAISTHSPTPLKCVVVVYLITIFFYLFPQSCLNPILELTLLLKLASVRIKLLIESTHLIFFEVFLGLELIVCFFAGLRRCTIQAKRTKHNNK